MRKLGLLNARYHLFDSFFTFAQYGKKANANFVKVTYKLDSGEIAGVVYSPNYMKDILDLIPEDTIVCQGCGKRFVPSSKGQTNLCENCYRKKRYIDKNHPKLTDVIHKTCVNCGTEFECSAQSKTNLCTSCYRKKRNKDKRKYGG